MVFEDAYKGIKIDDSLKTILDLSTDYYISVDDTAGHSGELSKRQELAKKNFKKLIAESYEKVSNS